MGSGRDTAQELETKVESLLKKANVNYKKRVVIGETQPDFLVTTEAGDQIVIEAHDWQGPDATARALNQARRYMELSKSAALVIAPAVAESVMASGFGVASLAGMGAAMAKL